MAKKSESKSPEEVVVKTETPEEMVVKKDKFPVVGGNGRFQMVPFKDGFVIYNPVGQRATGVVDEVYAKDMVAKSNHAIGIKG